MKIKIRLAPKVGRTFGGWKQANVVRFSLMQNELCPFLYFKGTGCQGPPELDTHQINSTRSDF